MTTASLSRRTAFGAVAALTLAAGAASVLVAPAANAASVAGTLSAVSGPSGGGNTITMTTATTKFVSGSTFVEFQVKGTAAATCAANWQAAATVTATAGVIVQSTVKILSGTKIAFAVPSGVALPSSTSSLAWNVCVYNGNTAASTSTTANIVIVNAGYTIAAAPTLTGVSPAGGPALGGGTVTVTGTGFVTGMSAKLGSQALTGVTVASNGNSFTATVPAQSSGAYNLSITTPGGTVNKTPVVVSGGVSSGGVAVPYTYSNGIVVSPATTPTSTASTDLDINGVGFSSLDFTTTDGASAHRDNTAAHVYLVTGAYDPTDNSGAKTTPEVGECVNVAVISDTELLCTLNTLHAYNQSSDSAIADGVYTVYVVNDGQADVQAATGSAAAGANYDSTDPFNPSVISSGSTFTVAAY